MQISINPPSDTIYQDDTFLIHARISSKVVLTVDMQGCVDRHLLPLAQGPVPDRAAVDREVVFLGSQDRQHTDTLSLREVQRRVQQLVVASPPPLYLRRR